MRLTAHELLDRSSRAERLGCSVTTIPRVWLLLDRRLVVAVALAVTALVVLASCGSAVEEFAVRPPQTVTPAPERSPEPVEPQTVTPAPERSPEPVEPQTVTPAPERSPEPVEPQTVTPAPERSPEPVEPQTVTPAPERSPEPVEPQTVTPAPERSPEPVEPQTVTPAPERSPEPVEPQTVTPAPERSPEPVEPQTVGEDVVSSESASVGESPPEPPASRSLPLPVLAPAWEPTTILIAKEDVNRIIPVYDAPGGTRLAFPDGDVWSYTFEGNRLVVRLTQGSQGDEWVEVELGVRPNGATGWVRAEDFNWTTVNHHIHIDVSDRSVALYDGDALVVSTRAIVGKPATPTPTLRGFISEKLPNHSQQNGSIVYGEWILFLSFYSEVLNSFGGGLPVVALHGTHIPERVGEALSNGCIRIPNDIIEAVARTAPLGTVVNVAA